MICPRCGKNLLKDSTHNTISFPCPAGCGRYITLAGLRSCGAEQSVVNTLWSNARNGNFRKGLPCPNCNQPMHQLKIGDEQIRFDLDVCTACQALWFDTGELENIPLSPPPVQPASQKDLANLEPITTGYDHLPDGDGPDQFWKYLPAILGLPVEQYSISCKRLPLVTWGFAFLCIVLYVLTIWKKELEITKAWGFIPALWLRNGGTTIFSAMFLHGGVLHLLWNIYFLLMCGDNVEDVLGRIKYSVLILLSGLSGNILYALTTTQPDTACIGASGFISGIIAFYTVMFPQQTFSFFLGGTRHFTLALYAKNFFFSIPVWLWFSLYAIGQILCATLVSHTNIAYTAHIGGFIPGIIWGLIEKYKSKRSENHPDPQSVIK